MGLSDLAGVLAGAAIVSSAYGWSAAILSCLFVAFWVSVRRALPVPSAPVASARNRGVLGWWRSRSRGVRFFLAGWVGASLLGALALTLVLRSYPVDVGLELLEPVQVRPALCVQGPDGAEVRLAEMERVPERFGLGVHPFVEIQATAQHNPESKGSQVWIEPSDALDQWTQTPPGAWRPGATAGRIGTQGAAQATIRGESALGRDAEIGFLKSPFAGIVRVRTAEGERTVDLYAPQIAVQRMKVPVSGRSALYYARVPRGALRGLVLRFAQDAAPRVSRLYVGTLVPTIATPSPSYSGAGWGRVRMAWPAALHEGVLALPEVPAYERGGAATFALMALLWLVGLGACGGVAFDAVRAVRHFWGEPLPNLRVGVFRWRRLAAFWAPAVLYWTFWLAIFYPGVVNADAVDQWNQAKTGVYCDHHPAVLAFGIAALTHLWDSPAIVVLAQILVLSLALSLGADLLWRLGIHRAAVIGAYLVALLSPKNSNQVVALMKDVPFAAATLGACVLLAALLVSEPLRRKVWPWVALGLVLAGCRLVRHNGSAVLYPMLLLAGLLFWRGHLRAVVLAALVAVVAILGVRTDLYAAMRVPHYEFNATLLAELSRLGSVVHQRVPLSEREAVFLDKARSLEDGWAYDAVSMGGVYYTAAHPLDWGFMLHHRAEFDRLFFSLAARNPLVYLRHSLQNLDYLFAPVAHEATPIEGPMTRTAETIPAAERWGLKTTPLLPGLYRATVEELSSSDRPAYTWLFWRPTLSIYACVAAMIVLLWRTRDWRFVAIYLPPLLVLPSLTMAFVQCVRFVLPATFTAPFLVCLAFMPLRTSGASHSPTDVTSQGDPHDDASGTCGG